jgi:hypothetical protein
MSGVGRQVSFCGTIWTNGHHLQASRGRRVGTRRAQDDSRAMAIAVGQSPYRRNLVCLTPSSRTPISPGSRFARFLAALTKAGVMWSLVVDLPCSDEVKGCVNGCSSCSSLATNIVQVPTRQPTILNTIRGFRRRRPLPLPWSLSRYRARCDRRGPAIEVAGSLTPTSLPVFPPTCPWSHQEW